MCAYDSQGLPHVAYVSNSDLKYAWVTCIPICFWHTEVVDDTSGGIPEVSITINETFDLPRIA